MVKYRFVDEEEKPVAKFKYVGNDEFGKAPSITFYGFSFKLGETTEVTDEYAINKLRAHFDEAFEEVNGEDDEKRKPGRPRKTDEEREAEKAEREADKAQRDAEKARREQERADEKAQREAEKEGAQPKVTEVGGDDQDWEKGRKF